MGKFIAFGKYNKLYKYLWIYIAIRVVNEYFFGTSFPRQVVIELFRPENFPPNIIIQENFNYLGAFIFSIFLHYYEQKTTRNSKIVNEGKFQSVLDSGNQIEYIYSENDPIELTELSLLSIIFPLILSILSLTLMSIFTTIGFGGLDIWVFDLFFVSHLSRIIFDRPIFGHKKIALLFIIIFANLFKIISTLVMIYDDEKRLIYKNHIVIIPFAIIIYIMLSFLRNYSLCKIKWLLDIKYVSVGDLLMNYNLIGTIMLFIAGIISNFVKCADKSDFDDVDIICKINIERDNKFEYYFDKYSYFFEKLWQKDKNVFLNIFYLLLFIIKLFFNFLRILFSLLIIKHLSQEFYMYPACIYFFIIKLLNIINAIINNENILPELFNAIAELITIICTMIYLELIELKFLNLNRDLRKNIELRALSDYRSVDSEEDD